MPPCMMQVIFLCGKSFKSVLLLSLSMIRGSLLVMALQIQELQGIQMSNGLLQL